MFRFLMVFACLFLCVNFLLGPATATQSRTVPVTATIIESNIRYLVGEAVYTRYIYHVDGKEKRHRLWRYSNLGESAVPDKIGTTLTVWINQWAPDQFALEYTPFDFFEYYALNFWILSLSTIGLGFAFWHIWVGLARPAAAGFRHRLVPGKSLWVRVIWRENLFCTAFYPHWILPTLILVSYTIIVLRWWETVAVTFMLITLGLLFCRGIWLTSGRNADIEADLIARTLRLPVASENVPLNKISSVREHRMIALKDAARFALEVLDEPIRYGDNPISKYRLVLRLKDGGKIPLLYAFNLVIPGHRVLHTLNLLILAHWLNEQLGLRDTTLEALI
ncbi:MAG: DUF3592 domain-containing protein [Candidatus Methylacidiphilales bacterium]|nr:DUF3592 domain-containing protein [Candidatus Methylacidiphilales bacterium]